MLFSSVKQWEIFRLIPECVNLELKMWLVNQFE